MKKLYLKPTCTHLPPRQEAVRAPQPHQAPILVDGRRVGLGYEGVAEML